MKTKHAEAPMLLALGGEAFVKSISSDVCRVVSLSFTQFGALNDEEFKQLEADHVCSPLFNTEMDCIETGQLLHSMGFQGTYFIIADALPNPSIISRELKQLYPDLSFEILTPATLRKVLRTAQND